MSEFGVDQWVEMFDELGVDEARRKKWHQLFEQRHPQAHQRFLEWLGLDAARIKKIRSVS